MTKQVDDGNLEKLSGGTLDNTVDDDRGGSDPGTGEDDPIAAPVQDDLQNEADGGGNSTFGR